jgi:hypothetical protein
MSDSKEIDSYIAKALFKRVKEKPEDVDAVVHLLNVIRHNQPGEVRRLKEIWSELLTFVASRLGDSEEAAEIYEMMIYYNEEFRDETRTKE